MRKKTVTSLPKKASGPGYIVLPLDHRCSKPNNQTQSTMPRQTTKNINQEPKVSDRAKRWCYTLNNPLQPIPWNELTQEYHVYGEEVGESGTPHYQGFIVFKNLKRLNQLKEINSKAHWEISRGTNAQASDYCKKDGKFHEYGTLPEEKHAYVS